MLRSGRILARKITTHGRSSLERGKAPALQLSARRPSIRTADAASVHVRTYTSCHDGKPGLGKATIPSPQHCPSLRPAPLITVDSFSKTSPLHPEKQAESKSPPFDKLTQALFDNLYSKLPLDHTKYKKIAEKPGDYALLLLDNKYVLTVSCSFFDHEKLSFPLHPEDVSKVLASTEELEGYVTRLRNDSGIRYSTSLEIVDEMRKMFDPDYRTP